MSLPTIKVAANTIIFKEGGYDKTMFIVLEGRVKIYIERHEEEIELAVIDKYDFFGEMALYRNRPRSASAKVLTDAKLVVIKNQMQLEQFISENPAFAGKMMVIMGNRLANTNDLLLEKMHELSKFTLNDANAENIDDLSQTYEPTLIIKRSS